MRVDVLPFETLYSERSLLPLSSLCKHRRIDEPLDLRTRARLALLARGDPFFLVGNDVEEVGRDTEWKRVMLPAAGDLRFGVLGDSADQRNEALRVARQLASRGNHRADELHQLAAPAGVGQDVGRRVQAEELPID